MNRKMVVFCVMIYVFCSSLTLYSQSHHVDRVAQEKTCSIDNDFLDDSCCDASIVTKLNRVHKNTKKLVHILKVMKRKICTIGNSTTIIENTTNNIQNTVNNIENMTNNIQNTVNDIQDTTNNIDSTTNNIESTVNNIQNTTNNIDNTVNDIQNTTNDILDTTNNIQNIVNEIANKQTCDDAEILIHQADIPYVINAPGVYCLAEDVTVTSGDAITVAALSLLGKRVVIDLNEHTIYGNGGDNGIVVLPTKFILPVSIILEIKNGSIINMIEHGIHIPIGIEGLMLDSVTTELCGNNGVSLDQGGFVIGGIAGTLSPTIINCKAFGGEGFLLGTGGGFILHNCQNFLLSNCIASRNVLDGFSIESNSVVFYGGIFESCISSNNGGNGFMITAGGDDTTLINCTAKQNQLSGFFVSSNYCFLKNNIAEENLENGFYCEGQSCQIRDNTAMTNNQNGGFFGFWDAGLNNRVYGNYANANFSGSNYSPSIVNVATSPLYTDTINFTANIEE